MRKGDEKDVTYFITKDHTILEQNSPLSSIQVPFDAELCVNFCRLLR